MKKYYFVFVVIFSVSLPASSEVYKWVDENGNVHFSDKPPSSDSNSYSIQGSQSNYTISRPETNSASSDAPVFSQSKAKLDACTTHVCNLVKQTDPNCASSDCNQALKYSQSCADIICRQKKMKLIGRLEDTLERQSLIDNKKSPKNVARSSGMSEETRARIVAECERHRNVYCDKGAEYILEQQRKPPQLTSDSPLERLQTSQNPLLEAERRRKYYRALRQYEQEEQMRDRQDPYRNIRGPNK